MEKDELVRKRKEDWLEAGMKVLGQAGIQGLTIERMTQMMGVTKGSFYHHFQNMAAFEEELVAHWADQYLSTPADLPDEPLERLALLDTIMEEAFGAVTEPEVALRAWAQQDEKVRGYVEQVDQARRAFLLNVFRPLTGDESQARLMADMLFAMAIGSITALPRLSPDRVLDLCREFKRLYGLEEWATVGE